MTTSERRDLDGIILIDKPGLLTSNAVLQQAKRLFGARKAGHTGSLDPLATGMLPLCFGEATKFAQYGLDADKCYAVTALFGITTDTGDAQGAVLKEVKPCVLSEKEMEDILPEFRGESLQIPPMYSALKHQGKKLYEFARAGINIERNPRPITIYDLDLVDINQAQAQFIVRCSKGTYIRTLIEDIGARLGFGAHVVALRRLYTAGFEEQPMYTLEQLTALTATERDACLLPVDYLLQSFAKVIVSDYELTHLYQGRAIKTELHGNQGLVRLYDTQQGFHGLAEVEEHSGLLKPKRLMVAT